MNDKPNDTTWQAKWGEEALSKGVTPVPRAFLLHAGQAGLNPAQQILLIHLMSYWWKASRDPFPSLTELRKRTGMSEKTIGKHLKALEERKWISRKRRYNNSYRFDLDRLARRVGWLAARQDNVQEEAAKAAEAEQQAPPQAREEVPSYTSRKAPVLQPEEPHTDTDNRFSPSFEEIQKFMEEGE